MPVKPIIPRGEPLPAITEGLDVEWVQGWRSHDERLRRDALEMWRRNGAIPEDDSEQERLKELVLGGYVHGKLAAVATARVRHLGFLRRRFAMLRVFVDPEFRLNNINRWIALHAIQALESWSAQHPEEQVMGVGSIVQYKADVFRAPILRGNLVLVGYTEQNEQIRIAWFEHADVDIGGR